jgi:Type II secretory pathway, ATPase PulE/Tfp pilus assembly pathway, ATPase PilB
LIYPQELVSPISEEIVESLLPIAKQKGMMLFAGPMGSGKTSLMYALTRQLSYKKRVMCIEDPIEIVEDSFLQLQVNEEAGMTYEELIKTTLRHRPGILIIGEIRDAKTAQQAIRAAICGYTVMSTIHGKSKYSVIQRLQQFGVSDEEISNAINLISYQRLIPTYDDLQIFLDTLNATEIKEYLENNLKDDRWGQGIRKIYQAGRIDEDVYQEFVNG